MSDNRGTHWNVLLAREGKVADKSSSLVLDALSRAAADPAGVPLFIQKTAPGLFAGTATARKAAQRCKELDLLRVVRTETNAKGIKEVVAITSKGLDHLVTQANPRQLLLDLVRAVDSRDQQLAEWIDAARRAQSSLDTLRQLAAAAVQRLEPPRIPPTTLNGTAPVDSAGTVLRCVEQWSGTNTAEDCPLPHLYRQLKGVTIGQFHDVLRRLHAEQRIYLHPWTGPLCDLPEPPMALMVGHEIAYYASPRDEGRDNGGEHPGVRS
jgi:hypothetical protein